MRLERHLVCISLITLKPNYEIILDRMANINWDIVQYVSCYGIFLDSGWFNMAWWCRFNADRSSQFKRLISIRFQYFFKQSIISNNISTDSKNEAQTYTRWGEFLDTCFSSTFEMTFGLIIWPCIRSLVSQNSPHWPGKKKKKNRSDSKVEPPNQKIENKNQPIRNQNLAGADGIKTFVPENSHYNHSQRKRAFDIQTQFGAG